MKCWFYRTWMSLRWERGLGARTRRHLGRCGECREYYETLRELEGGLRQQAAAEREPAPPFLKARILAAAAREARPDPTPAQPGGRGRSWLWAAAATAACGAVGMLLQMGRPAPDDQAWPAGIASTWIERGTNEWARIKHLETPLEREARFVLSDAKSAFLAVADGVLPSQLLAGAEPQE